jgi:hypothetical protein
MNLSLIDISSFELIMVEFGSCFVFVVIGLQDLLKSLWIKAQIGLGKDKHHKKVHIFPFLYLIELSRLKRISVTKFSNFMS